MEVSEMYQALQAVQQKQEIPKEQVAYLSENGLVSVLSETQATSYMKLMEREKEARDAYMGPLLEFGDVIIKDKKSKRKGRTSNHRRRVNYDIAMRALKEAVGDTGIDLEPLAQEKEKMDWYYLNQDKYISITSAASVLVQQGEESLEEHIQRMSNQETRVR